MSLREHLYELRHRLGLAVLFVVLGGVFGFIWFMLPLGPVPSLGRILLDPYCALPTDIRFEPRPGDCQLFQTKPFEAFMVQFKVGIAVGIVVMAPGWLYQVWAFITPGLYARERRVALTFVLIGSVLFACGGWLAFFVIPQGLEVLMSFGGGFFVTALNASDYISFVLVMLLIFGVSFLLPLLITMLNRVGVLPYANLKRWRRFIIFGLFIFAAFATPGTDPVSMVVLAAAMTVLFEVAVQIARVHDRRKAKREALEDAQNSTDVDSASELDLSVRPVEPARNLDDVT
ncbi:twin-arginine translocase subunit TatC [Actinokineospora guangxiensis]|uniref:Sec-independent protein translocase protein TatC n=1 Tax=Actinokineospora guangxiensis TaxID=1490288 RepID=A0ABW0ETP8_9PSEU